MSQVSSSQLMSTSNVSPTYRRAATATLWAMQIVCALLFLGVGSMKLMAPAGVLLAQMPLPLPILFIRFIAVCEVAGALGIVLPGLTRIRRELTPLAAGALALEMMGATGYTVLGGGGASAVVPLLIGLICAAIAYGRRSFFATF
jgi:uncharacterized membrane protein YphA (DoxX/SURF4 family)